MSTSVKWFLLGLALFVVTYNFFLPAHPDEAYYWQWSRHLALSYYDGPPLTAYFIRMLTELLGSSAFTIKLVAVVLSLLNIITVYYFAKKLFNERTAFVSVIILSFLPIIQSAFVVTTLDQTLILFWTLTLFSFYQALNTQKNAYRYLTGLCLGLCLLAKYPGILLVPSFIIYLIIAKKWREFTNIHWYLAALIALAIFSPVIIWNWQHQWASFDFQYAHGTANVKHFQWTLLGSFMGGQIGIINPILFFTIFYYVICKGKMIFKNHTLLFLVVPFAVTFLFFLYEGLFKVSQANWPVPAYISAIILISHFICHYNKKVLFAFITILSLILLIFIRFPITTPFLPNQAILLSKFLGYKSMVEEATPTYLRYGNTGIIASNNYSSASELALYLPGQPQVYILGGTQKEYFYWSAPIIKKIREGKIQSVLYIGDKSGVSVLNDYFKNIIFIKTLNYHGKWNNRQWVIYRAWN